ncbi:hypothetical protein LGM47_03570 [Burkholderia cepacia]|nr:hypothetical protein [Burkholderia cepacia]MCA8024388.1 hypothetical protein [Burkholderia cepacia]
MPMKHDPAQWLQRPIPPFPDLEPDPDDPDPGGLLPDLPEPYRQPAGDPPGTAPPEREPPSRQPPVHAPSVGGITRLHAEARR